MDMLAIEALGLETAGGVVRDPPLVMIGIAGARHEPAGLELLGVGTLADFVDHGLGNDLLLAGPAVVAQHLAEAAEIAQCGADPDAGNLRAGGIDPDKAVLFGADIAPD